MKVEHTMTPEEIAQWEKATRLSELWPASALEKCGECNYEGPAGWMPNHARVHRRPHGHAKYLNEGCRCPECVTAAQAAHRRYYLTGKMRREEERVMALLSAWATGQIVEAAKK